MTYTLKDLIEDESKAFNKIMDCLSSKLNEKEYWNIYFKILNLRAINKVIGDYERSKCENEKRKVLGYDKCY